MSYYDWQATFSRQTGTQGEICIVDGGKGIGKTFGLRLQCVRDFLKGKRRFCEICRTKEELKNVISGYFDKLQHEGFFTDHVFKVEKNRGYIAPKPHDDEKPEYELICYFTALTAFQTEKKRTYADVYRFIFDEAVIDRKDRYHRYLPNEFLILANLLDSVSRQQPGDPIPYRVYLLCNSCDLSSPYHRYLGIDKIPVYGYHWYRGKTVLYHHCPPIDAEERRANTLVGRMLEGHEESKMIFENEYRDTSCGEVEKKTAQARYAYTIRYSQMQFSIWIDYRTGIVYVNELVPKQDANVYVLTKKDSTIDYRALKRSDGYLKVLSDFFYMGALRYSSLAVRESFLTVLDYIGVK